MDKKSFVMYTNWATLIANLPDEQAGMLAKAICSYQIGQKYEITDPTVNAMFLMILDKMQEDTEAYEEIRKKRSDSAKAKWEKAKSANAIPRDASASLENANAGMKLQMDGDNENDTDTDNVTDTDNDTPNGVYITSPNGDVHGATAPRIDIQPIIDEWNTLPEPVPKVQKLSAQSTRAKCLRARISQYGIDKVMQAIENVRNSPFLLGRVKDFVITFDWFVKPNNFSKVLDGNYLAHDRPDIMPDAEKESTTAYLFRRIEEEEAKEAQNDQSRSS